MLCTKDWGSPSSCSATSLTALWWAGSRAALERLAGERAALGGREDWEDEDVKLRCWDGLEVFQFRLEFTSTVEMDAEMHLWTKKHFLTSRPEHHFLEQLSLWGPRPLEHVATNSMVHVFAHALGAEAQSEAEAHLSSLLWAGGTLSSPLYFSCLMEIQNRVSQVPGLCCQASRGGVLQDAFRKFQASVPVWSTGVVSCV